MRRVLPWVFVLGVVFALAHKVGLAVLFLGVGVVLWFGRRWLAGHR